MVRGGKLGGWTCRVWCCMTATGCGGAAGSWRPMVVPGSSRRCRYRWAGTGRGLNGRSARRATWRYRWRVLTWTGWRCGERLLVAGQELLGSPEAEAWRRWRRPPCPEPEDGWPEGDECENLPIPNDLRASLPIVSICLFRPSPRQVVLVVAAEQPVEVEAALRPHIGARMCVIASRWTRRQIDDLAADLRDGMREWLIYQCGESATADGQAVVFAKVARVLPAFAGWATPLPDGLLRIEPWLINVEKGYQMVGR
jgi:hypothetical protein